MFVTAIVPALVIGALQLMPPTTMGMRTDDPGSLVTIVLGGAIFAYLVGLTWMIRIYRTDPERHESFWRSRRY